MRTPSAPISLRFPCKPHAALWRFDCNLASVEQPLTFRTPSGTPEQRFKVLVADDQEGITHALQFLLKSADIDVRVVHSPREVLDAIASDRSLDLVLMDMNYGRDTTSGQEGLELVDAIRKRDPHLQIVVMTAWSTIDLAVTSLQHGAADFLQKPWENETALKMVHRQALLTRDNRARAARTQYADEDALKVQQALMGAAHKSYGRFSVAGATRAANLVGGDYFDSFLVGEGRFAFCIADSMGKGTAAALAMANLQAQVRSEAATAISPAEVCSRLNQRIFESRLQRLTTMFYGLVDIGDGLLRYTNAGHSPAFLIKRDGSINRLQSNDALLGAIPSWFYHECGVTLEGGDRLIAVTDGLLESTDSNGNELGEEALLQHALACRDQASLAMLNHIMEGSLHQAGEHFQDDTTAVVVGVD